ncbi:ECM33-like protein [Metarhizium album ARSEF 1941]|uniref:ECM33-like protein n=1 Tax=Metarhizium album (strain ARSEF 1941) TaxID=1081103 RepID=A0A0B2WSQ2_METAS|nr:ECM33-like protein [Metarhizium album ARSEF 1941]KHN96649.1 ECM33-like protein [Metarhizium album ARSEF 1941]
MHPVTLFPAILAVAGVASAATTCSKDVKITQPTPVIDCDVVEGDVTVDASVAGSLSLEGPRQIKGDFIINNASQLVGVSSSSLRTVDGTCRIQGCELLNAVSMPSFQKAGNLEFINLPQLTSLSVGNGSITVMTVRVQDTFASDLKGLNVATVDNMTISNNRRLNTFNSTIQNVTNIISIVDNAGSMQIDMPNLESAGELDFRSIKNFDAPRLKTANRLSFQESPDLLSVSANKLTQIKDSLTLENNKKLENISFTSLEKINGDMTIRNNTALEKINLFPELTTIGGAMLLAGSFNTVEMPKLNDIKGAVTVTSTTDISSFCSFFNGLSKSKAIQGKASCTSNNAKANEGGKGGTSTNGTDSAAVSLGINHALLGFAAVAGFAQLI